jgi:hypothetical protein
LSVFPHARHLTSIAIVVYFLLTTIVLFALLSDWGNDDPYITYRYAENFYAGRGFVYNPGERLLSTTSPLFALLLAGVRVFWSEIPRAANLIGAASLAVGALFLWDIARQWKEPLSGWTALTLYPTFGLLISTLGSETPLYLALCLGAIAFYVRQNYTKMAILLALACLTRGDAAILGGVLAADWFIKNPPRSRNVIRTLPWSAIVVGAAILLTWALIATLYFGSPLPVTFAVKRAQGLMDISQKFAPGFLVILRPYTQSVYFWVEIGLLMIGVIYAFRRARPWLLLAGWAVLYFLVYTALGVTRYFWYYAPLVPGMVGMIGLGLSAVQRVLFSSQVARRALSGVTILILAGLAISQVTLLPKLRANPDPRLIPYRMVGEWLSQNTPPTATIGALEVGVIGYYAAPRPMVDFAGLIQPEVATLFAPQITYQDTATWAISKYTPDFLVLHDGVFPRLEQTFVAENCAQVINFPGNQTGYSQNLVIYQCQYP